MTREEIAAQQEKRELTREEIAAQLPELPEKYFWRVERYGIDRGWLNLALYKERWLFGPRLITSDSFKTTVHPKMPDLDIWTVEKALNNIKWNSDAREIFRLAPINDERVGDYR